MNPRQSQGAVRSAGGPPAWVMFCLVGAMGCLYVLTGDHLAVGGLIFARLGSLTGAAALVAIGLAFGLPAGRGNWSDWVSFRSLLALGIFLGLCSLSSLAGVFPALVLLSASFLVWRRLRRKETAPTSTPTDAARRTSDAASAPARGEMLVFAALFFFAVTSLLCAFTPPWEYDDQEYHSGSVAWYLSHRTAWSVPENVYSHFPQNAEMLSYGLSRWFFSPGPWSADDLHGIYAGKLLNAALGLCIALLVGWMTRRSAADRSASRYAMVFFYCSPAILVFSAVAYVEMALTFYLFLGLCLFLIYVETDPADRRARIRHAALCGVACGLAAGCKYQGVLFGIAPFALFVGIENLMARRPSAAVRDTGILLLAALVLFSPWLIRNLALTGNPVFPLMYSVFGGHGWDAAHNAMWVKAHAPGPMTLAEFIGGLRDFIANSPLTPVLAFLFIPLLFLRPKALNLPARWVLAYVAVFYVLWFIFTQRIDRFLAPALPAFAVLSALGFSAWQEGRTGKALKGVVALGLIFTLYQGLIMGSNLGAFTAGLHPGEKERFFRDNTDFRDVYDAIQAVNDETKAPKSKVLFFAEARAFYCNADRLAPAVFNTNPLETALQESATPQEAAAQLKAQGFTHLLVNWTEFARLHTSYGAYADFDFKKWLAFRDHALTPLASFGKPYKGNEQPIVVYAIKR